MPITLIKAIGKQSHSNIFFLFFTVSEYFPVDKEDIIHNTELSQSASRINNVIAPQALPSQPNDILFIEKKGTKCFGREGHLGKSRATHTRHPVNLVPAGKMLDSVSYY